MITADVAVIGAGIAGASLAAELAPDASVLLLEAEAHPGFHATGRSAAFWSETYGGPLVQPLTTASGPFLRDPPPAFSERGFLKARGAIHIARTSERDRLANFAEDFAGPDVRLFPLDAAAVHARVPGLHPDWAHGIAEPACSDIDVAALHEAYLRAHRRHDGRVLTDARARSITAQAGGWRIRTERDEVSCKTLVNAAGAWADEVASRAGARPLNLQPYRRTVLQLAVDPPAPADLPLVIDVAGRFYFKGEAGGRIWLSPHDETPCEPCDSAPEELDIALAIDRLQQVTDWRVVHVERSWSGLRTFAPDRLPVYGYDADVPGFFWCAGQGGFGIQTAPAAAKLAAALLLRRQASPNVAHLDPLVYAPARFRAGR